MSCCGCGSKVEEGILSGRIKEVNQNLQMPLIRTFEERLKRKKINGRKAAVHFSERAKLTYTQLNAFASCLAKNIVDRLGYDYKVENPDKELVIAICLPMSEKSIALILGILKTGAAYLPLDPHFPEDLMVQILTTFKPVMLITDDNGKIFNKYDLVKMSHICKICSIEELWLDTDFVLEPKTRRASMDKAWEIDFLETPKPTMAMQRPVVIFYTHGLRNNPVGVRLSNKSMINLLACTWKQFKMTRNTTCCVTVSIANLMSIGQIFIPLLVGCTLHLFRRSEVVDMDNFVKNVSWKAITTLSFLTHHLGDFLDSIDFLGRETMLKSLKNLKLIVCCGALITPSNAKWFFDIFTRGVDLGNCTGSAETSGPIAQEVYASWKDYESKLITGRPSLGTVVDNVRVHILDDNLGIVPDGSQGEICVSGDCLAIGYVSAGPKGGQGEGTTFIKNPHQGPPGFDTLYRTGEYGRILKTQNGKRRLYLEGRHDSLVKVHGHVFTTEDVSDFLKDFDCVTDAYVFVSHAGQRNQEVIGFVSLESGLKSDQIPSPIEFEFTLKEYLPEWAIPDEIKIIQKIPVHWVERKSRLCPHCLIQLFRKEREPANMEWDIAHKLPDEETKLLVRAIFKFCSFPLPIILLNLGMSLYELGASSLNSMGILVYLNENGYPLNIQDLLDATSLMEVTRVMQKKKSGAIGECIPLAKTRPEFYTTIDSNNDMIVTELNPRQKDPIIDLLSSAYSLRNELQDYDLITTRAFQRFFQETWTFYVGKESLSIMAVANDHDKQLIGALLAYDYFTVVDPAIPLVLEITHDVKGVFMNYVPHYRNETLEISWLATAANLNPQDNVRIVTVLLQGIITKAQEHGYSGIFIVISNALVRDLCIDVFGFILLDDYPANRYIDRHGKHPYHLANDTVVITACFLRLRDFVEPAESKRTSLKIDPEKIFPRFTRESFLVKPSQDALSRKNTGVEWKTISIAHKCERPPQSEGVKKSYVNPD